MKKSQGKIIIESQIDIWPHELITAEALANAGFIITFARKNNNDFQRSPDIYIDGFPYEIKAPKSPHLSVVEKNINKALSQSVRIIFDSIRMKRARDVQIIRELNKSLTKHRKIKVLLFIDKNRTVHRLK